MDVVTFSPGRTALTFGTSKINLHQAGQEFEPKALRPTPGSADICLIVNDDIADVITQLATAGVLVEAGPVERTGATGPIMQLLPARSRSQPHRTQQLPALITTGPAGTRR